MLDLRYNEMWSDWYGTNELARDDSVRYSHGQLVLSWKRLNVTVKMTTQRFFRPSKTTYKQILHNGKRSIIPKVLRETISNDRNLRVWYVTGGNWNFFINRNGQKSFFFFFGPLTPFRLTNKLPIFSVHRWISPVVWIASHPFRVLFFVTSFRRILGLPEGLFPAGFCTITARSSGFWLLQPWPAHLSLPLLITFNVLFISSNDI